MHVTSHGHDPLWRLDRALERLLGVDLRLLYGFAVPVLVVCGLIFLLAAHPSYPLVGGVVVIEVVLLALIVVKVLAMTGDEDDG